MFAADTVVRRWYANVSGTRVDCGDITAGRRPRNEGGGLGEIPVAGIQKLCYAFFYVQQTLFNSA